MSVRSLMKQRVTLQRSQPIKDSSGGFQENYQDTSFVRIAASIQPAGSQVRLFWAQQGLEVSHQVYLPVDVNALAKDRFQVVQTGATRYLLVNGYREATAGRNRMWVADCRELPR